MNNMTIKPRYRLFLLILIFPALSFAAELEVVTENWRPYNYTENGKVKGVSTEIVKKVLNRAGIKYKIRVYPWARAYNMAQKKENVLIYTIIRIAQREKLFKWVRPLGNGGVTSLYRLKKNKHINPITIEEAKKYRIGANKNSMDHLWLEHNGFTILDTPPKVGQTIKMFFAGRFDMIAFDDAVMEAEFKNFGFDHTEADHVLPLFKTPPYMALSLSTSDDILKKLQKAYDALMKENIIKSVN